MADSDFPFYRPGRAEHDDTMSRASTAVKRKRKVDDEKFALGRRGILVFYTLSVLTLMAALDGTSLSVALPVSSPTRISYALKLTKYRKLQRNSMERLSKHSGVELRSYYAQQVSCYISTIPSNTSNFVIVFQPSFASFSNIFGRRPLILISLIFFSVGAILAAIANDFTYMLIGRSIQGVGGGGIISLSEVIITDLVPLRWRGQYFGILSAMWSVGSVTGPILGGGFSEKVSWVSWLLCTRNYPC